MIQKESTFNWVSNSVYEYYDPIQNIKFNVCLDTGINETNQFFSPLPLRLSLKLKSIKTNCTNTIDLSYHDVFALVVDLKNMFNNNIDKFEIKSNYKNKETMIKFATKSGKYFIKISDFSDDTFLVIGMDKFQYVSLSSILNQIKEKWVDYSINIQTTLSNYRLIQDFEKLKKDLTINTISNNLNREKVERSENDLLTETTTTLVPEFVKKEKFIKIPRPVLHNYLSWDLNHLHKWVSAFTVLNKSSNDLSFKPFELILYNSGCFSSVNEFQKSEYYYDFQYYILLNLRKSLLKNIENKSSYRFERSEKLFMFNDMNKFTPNDIEFWNFLVDIILLQNVYKLFLYSLKDIENIDQNESLYDIKMTELFLSIISTSLVYCIDNNYMGQLGDDVKKLFIKLSEDSKIHIFDTLKNSFSYVTSGGTFDLNYKSLSPFVDKYIETVSSNFTTDFYEITKKVNSVEDIVNLIVPKDLKEKIDKKFKLFIKVLRTELMEYEKYDNINNFKDVKPLLEHDFEKKLYNILKDEDNDSLPNLSNIKRTLDNNDKDKSKKVSFNIEDKKELKEVVTIPPTIPTTPTNDIFSIEDDELVEFNPFL